MALKPYQVEALERHFDTIRDGYPPDRSDFERLAAHRLAEHNISREDVYASDARQADAREAGKPPEKFYLGGISAEDEPFEPHIHGGVVHTHRDLLHNSSGPPGGYPEGEYRFPKKFRDFGPTQETGHSFPDQVGRQVHPRSGRLGME